MLTVPPSPHERVPCRIRLHPCPRSVYRKSVGPSGFFLGHRSGGGGGNQTEVDGGSGKRSSPKPRGVCRGLGDELPQRLRGIVFAAEKVRLRLLILSGSRTGPRPVRSTNPASPIGHPPR